MPKYEIVFLITLSKAPMGYFTYCIPPPKACGYPESVWDERTRGGYAVRLRKIR